MRNPWRWFVSGVIFGLVAAVGSLSLPSLDRPALASDPRPDGEIGLLMQGRQVRLKDAPPFIKGGRTMLPVRGVFQLMGVSVTWDEAARTVTATDGTKVLVMRLDDPVYTIDGAPAAKPLESPPHIYGGRTFVPGRAIFEAFGAKVDWVAPWREVRVTFPGELAAPDDNVELSVSTVGSDERGWRVAFFPAAPDALELPAYLSYDGTRFPDGLRIEGNDPSPTTRDQRWTPDGPFTTNTVWPAGETGLLQRGPVTFEKYPGEVGEPLLTFGVWRLSKEPVEFSFPISDDFLFPSFVWDWPVAELANGVGAGRGRPVMDLLVGTGNLLRLNIYGGAGAPLLWRPLEVFFRTDRTPWSPAPGGAFLELGYWKAQPFSPFSGSRIDVRVTSAWLWFDGFSITQDLQEAPFEGVPQVSDYYWRQARQP